MVILAYDVQGVILYHFVPHGETDNAQCYAAYLQNHLRRTVRRKRPKLQNVIILHDNATPHKGICVRDLLRCNTGDGKYWSIRHTRRTFHLMIMI